MTAMKENDSLFKAICQTPAAVYAAELIKSVHNSGIDGSNLML